MAMTEDRSVNDKSGGGKYLSLPCDKVAQTIYQGALVNTDATGFVVKAGDTVGHCFAGVAFEKVSYTVDDAADGGHVISVINKGVVPLPCETVVTQANIGNLVYVKDDEKVALTGDSTNKVGVGRIVKIEDATNKLVWVDLFAAACTPGAGA